MADNVPLTDGSGPNKAATREVSYSGETAQVQVVALATLNGGDDAKTVTDVTAANPLPVRLDGGVNPINVTNGAMQVENLGIEQAAEQLDTPIVNTGNDEPLQLVGLHPNYPLPIDTANPMPMAGRDPAGAQRQIAVDTSGAVRLADNNFLQGQWPAVQTGIMFVLDTTGYASVFATFAGGSGWNILFEHSNNGVNWFAAWALGNNNTAGWGTSTNLIVNPGYVIIPCFARFLRFRNNSVGVGVLNYTATLKLTPLAIPEAGYNVSLNQINNSTVVPANAQIGVNAFGPIAAGSAHGVNNPVQISGSDGTNVRRILTDTSGNTQVVGTTALAGSLIPPAAIRAPVLMGAADLEQRAQRLSVDGLSRIRIQNDESGTKDDGVVDALNNVVRELKLLNAKLTDLPYYLGINSVMPDDDKAFRDDPTIFNA